jgi:hypothetical protein
MGKKAGSGAPSADRAGTMTDVLAALGGSHLTYYMGKLVPGWYHRPKVGVDDACPQAWLCILLTCMGKTSRL